MPGSPGEVLFQEISGLTSDSTLNITIGGGGNGGNGGGGGEAGANAVASNGSNGSNGSAGSSGKVVIIPGATLP